jgi:ubiquinone/menaquinone biosynthesis C-methylase UbiE
LQQPTSAINKAFSKQSSHFDEEDVKNPVLQRMRKQVYQHVNRFLKPGSKILELNAGTGIDALHFIGAGNRVHATDLSDGMIEQLKRKIAKYDLADKLTVQQLSFIELDKINQNAFDFAFSNFGGLNCVDDLTKVSSHLPELLKPGAFITLVVMPVICPWELVGVFKNGKQSLRRLNPGGVKARLEGEHFQTYYHSLQSIKKAFGKQFKFIGSEGLATISAHPHAANFPDRYPWLDKLLTKIDQRLRTRFPFNRWGDHIIVTFQFKPRA